MADDGKRISLSLKDYLPLTCPSGIPENYYINTRLMNLFIEFGKYEPTEVPVNIESVHVNETLNM